MIKGRDVYLKYEKKGQLKTVLKGVSFEVLKGNTTAFIGKSGAGKTSLLRCLGGIAPNYEGGIYYGSNDLKAMNPQQRVSTIGFVFQQFHLFPHMSIFKNCLHPLISAQKRPKAEAKQIVEEYLDLLGIGHLAKASPVELSGGQQQRAAIARALCLGPDVLLLDEPTSALDPDNRNTLINILEKLRLRGMTIAISSHDIAFLKSVIDKVYFLEDGEIVEDYDIREDNLADKKRISQFIF